jgi:hypothetical protein
MEDMKTWLRELRGAYPTMSLKTFLEIFEAHNASDELLEKLDLAEFEALREKQHFEDQMRLVESRLRLGDLHTQLNIVVHHDLDLEHVQAVLMYGFISPGSVVVYAGANSISRVNVFTNTKNKLVARYSQEKADRALDYLVREGVLNQIGRKSNRAYSFNTDNSAATLHGQMIIAVVKAYLNGK